MDYPGHLYYFLIQLLSSLGEKAKWIWMTTSLTLFLSLLFLTVFYEVEKPLKTKNKLSVFLNSNSFFLLVAALFVILQRLPGLLYGPLTPDEDLWLAGGATIMNDPRFWLSFNPTTSGPLVVLPVILVKITGLQITYASVRLAALLVCILPAIFLMFYSFKNFFNEKISRFSILPLIIAVSFFQMKEFIAYNSEHVPFLLTSLSIFLFSKLYKEGDKASNRLYFLFGFSLGLFAFSKLQAVPMAIGMSIIFTVLLFTDRLSRRDLLKKISLFLSGGLLPLLLILFYLMTYNGWKDFWTSYLVSNFYYATDGLYGQIGYWLKLRYFIYVIRTMDDSGYYFISLTATSILAIIVLVIFKREIVVKYKAILCMALILMLSSYFGIIKPSTFYPHYFLLFFIPLIFFFGILMGLFQKSFKPGKVYTYFYVLFFFTTILLPATYAYVKAGSSFPASGNQALLKKEAVADFISAYARPGEKMAIWGWKTDLYIQTGLTLGTRYGDSFHQLTKSGLQPYYINNYLLDLKRNKPKIVIDAITPDAFFFNEIQDRHENYSEIDNYIKGNYSKIGEVDLIRIYIRH